MNAYVYQADLLCEECGAKACDELTAAGNAPDDPDDEYSYDSDEYPKGPYPDGGGEADCPQHCGDCHAFLENPLTSDGEEYVREAAERRNAHGGISETVFEWVKFYGIGDREPEEDNA